MPWRLRTADEDETRALGALLAEALQETGVAAMLVDLRGELGAGKTVFVRGLGRALGVPAHIPIVSPTFTIARAYGLPGPTLRELHHLDAYRLGTIDDLEAAGFEEMCGNGRLTCVEWGGNVDDALPEDRLHVELGHELLASDAPADAPPLDAPPLDAPGTGARRVTIRAGGPEAARVLAVMQRRHAAAQGA